MSSLTSRRPTWCGIFASAILVLVSAFVLVSSVGFKAPEASTLGLRPTTTTSVVPAPRSRECSGERSQDDCLERHRGRRDALPTTAVLIALATGRALFTPVLALRSGPRLAPGAAR